MSEFLVCLFLANLHMKSSVKVIVTFLLTNDLFVKKLMNCSRNSFSSIYSFEVKDFNRMKRNGQIKESVLCKFIIPNPIPNGFN